MASKRESPREDLGVEKGETKGEKRGSEGKDIRRLSSLTQAVDTLLQWPPASLAEKPPKAVLSRRAPEILQNLEDCTLDLVRLRASHVLVCLQGSWPRGLFHLAVQLRRTATPQSQLPIVFLCSVPPSHWDWGCLGIFQEVYFLRGNPRFEVDLVRANVARAGTLSLYFSVLFRTFSLPSLPNPLLLNPKPSSLNPQPPNP